MDYELDYYQNARKSLAWIGLFSILHFRQDKLNNMYIKTCLQQHVYVARLGSQGLRLHIKVILRTSTSQQHKCSTSKDGQTEPVPQTPWPWAAWASSASWHPHCLSFRNLDQRCGTRAVYMHVYIYVLEYVHKNVFMTHTHTKRKIFHKDATTCLSKELP